MPIIGPGPNDREYDNWDPTWKHHDTPFRLWIYRKLKEAGAQHADDIAITSAPDNRYNGLDDLQAELIATLTNTTIDEVRAAHREDLAAWAQEQQLHDHPDLAILDADLNRIAGRR
ncbi:hypothetical protein [Streptomyces achromogenes]|uniref:hypothetical protein n=1 Tax=Streptomyces achromogenes TaxID=67255 RepID=UPI003413BEC1